VRGCLHYYGFWEKLCLAYRLYWIEPKSFDKLGDFSLLKNGGQYGSEVWNLIAGKNIYKEVYYNSKIYPAKLELGTSNFKYDSAPEKNSWKMLLEAFSNSFGEW
jgi:hypothetical protein